MKKPISKGKKNNYRRGRFSKKSEPQFSYSSHKKNIDNVKLLFSYSLFRKEIKTIRDYLKIPKDGLKDEDSKKWHLDRDKESNEIMESERFLLQGERICQKIILGEISLAMGNKQARLLLNKMPWNYLSNSVNFLIEKFHVPLNYEQTIRRYILFNKIVFVPAQNFVVGGFDGSFRIKDARFLPIRIYAKLTDEDIEEIKDTIERFGKNLPNFQPLKDIDKRLTIEEWVRSRGKIDPLTGNEYQMTVEEIAENIYGNKKQKNKVRDNQRKLDEIRKKRFGKL
ncbi:MAG: hypothetical protein WC858_02595 [Parcubacteria group bacterium]|jgi:hypothetical protein